MSFENKPSADRRLWEFRWVRDLGVMISIALLVVLAYQIRAILLPMLIGLALAYVINPIVRFAQVKWKWPRWLTTGLILAVVIGFVGSLLVFVLPRLAGEAQLLLRRLPNYVENIAGQFGLSPRDLAEQVRSLIAGSLHASVPTTAPAATTLPDTMPAVMSAMPEITKTDPATTQPAAALTQIDLQTIGTYLGMIINLGLYIIYSALGIGLYLILASVVTTLCMFFFSWRLDRITAWFHSFIPTQKRTRAIHILGRMDVAVSSFIRGRIIQGTILAIVLSIGWTIVGVPYALLLALLCGCLNLVPYASLVGLPIAILLTWIDALSTGEPLSVYAVLVWPATAYIIGQQLDSWVVEPLVQGRATGLDPLAILLSVLIGTAMAGVFGTLLAVPIAACVKILSEEVLLPRLRRFLGSQEVDKPID